jgi:hypothetical protein
MDYRSHFLLLTSPFVFRFGLADASTLNGEPGIEREREHEQRREKIEA